MQTLHISSDFEHASPAGAEVRLLNQNEHGGMAHCTLKEGIVSKAVSHRTVSEFWHVLSGEGQIWRKDESNELITELKAGVSIDIPVGTSFQYRSNKGDLVFICVTMPPWSGSDEAYYVESGAWQPSSRS